ncbi:MAG: hypothetical protein M1818_000333 [Claussenomyces sp. TS43310]|nr:MAG: hypothetical protein M1818_000333 [Claussenomyces sp. TS43310]
MPPLLRQYGGGPNNIAAQYQQYSSHAQGHNAGLPPPGGSQFMNPNSGHNPFPGGNALMAQGFGGGAGGLGVAGGAGFASHDAQRGFAHGATLQQQAHTGMNDQNARGKANRGSTRIRDVWRGNMQEEMETLRKLVDKYPYISMDTEFPGVVARPMGSFRGKSDYHYQTLRANVDLLKLIQLGITLFTEEGEMTPARPQSSDSGIDVNMPGARNYGKGILPCTWQFNFQFSITEDMYSQASIESLRTAGVDFERHESQGINPFDFAALLISSGLVCDDEVRWISFHGGYDFGYLTKLMICQPLPDNEVEFEVIMKKFFPKIYDVKYLMKYAIKQHSMGQTTPLDAASTEILQKFDVKSSLESLAEILKVRREGPAHQGGSDALVTGKVFFQMREKVFNGEISDDHLNKVWGLGFPEGTGAFTQSTPQHYSHLQESSTSGQNGTGLANGTPSTPNTGHAGLANTPAHTSSSGVGPLTPGGGGGVFGQFQFRQ